MFDRAISYSINYAKLSRPGRCFYASVMFTCFDLYTQHLESRCLTLDSGRILSLPSRGFLIYKYIYRERERERERERDWRKRRRKKKKKKGGNKRARGEPGGGGLMTAAAASASASASSSSPALWHRKLPNFHRRAEWRGGGQITRALRTSPFFFFFFFFFLFLLIR